MAAPRVTGRNPRTEAQTLVRANLGAAATEFVNLAPEEIAAWNAYGASRSKTNPVNGKHYAQTGINAHVELATVFKPASPGAASPAMPPTTGFAGDALELALDDEGGALLVAGSGATSAGTVLEVSTALLKGRGQPAPKGGYVSRGFFAPTPAKDYLATVPVGPGCHAVRARYVRAATGQATLARTLGKATVLQTVAGGADVDLSTGEVLAPARRGTMKKAA